MTMFTPGPWRLDHNGYIMADQPGVPLPGEELPPRYEVASLGDGGPRLTVQEQADAQLIIAAPALFAALRDALAFLGARFGMARDPEAEEVLDRIVGALDIACPGVEPRSAPGEPRPQKPHGVCDKPATTLVYDRKANKILSCCRTHAREVVNGCRSEYTEVCANCGCLLPIN